VNGDRRLIPWAFCQSCNARILWAVTSTGRAMPVDYDPTPNTGNLIVTMDGTRVVVTFHANNAAAVAAAAGRPVRTPHHATCPQAGSWRSKQKDAR
jgi:hypothetical protein